MLLLWISASVKADVPYVAWSRIYGGEASDLGTDMQITGDGGFIFAGESASYNLDNYDVYVVRTNANGDTLWTRAYGGGADEEASSIRPTSDDGWIISGTTESFGAGSDDMWLIKIDANGNQQWQQTYGTAVIEYGTGAEQTADGGYILCGYTTASEFANPDARLIKTNSIGTEVWARTFGTESMEAFYDVHQLPDHGFVICGYNEDLENGNGSWDAWVVKTDSMGLNPAGRYYGGFGWDVAYSIVRTTDGGFAFAGTTDVNFSINPDFYFVKTNANLDTAWTRHWGRPQTDEPWDIIQTSDGGYLATGHTCIILGSECRYDILLVKTDASGDSLWTFQYGSTQSEGAYSARQTTNGSYVVVGYNTSPDVLDYDLLVLRVGMCADPTPRAPVGLTARSFGNDIRLIWRPVTQSVTDCPLAIGIYTVFSDTSVGGSFSTVVGSTADTIFTDPNAVQNNVRKFYRITATGL